MTTAAELRTLAEEVECLSGPDREMDVRIEIALGANRYLSTQSGATIEVREQPGWITCRQARPLTASIDAAASLMPEGWYSASGALEWQDRTMMLDRPGRAWNAEAWRPGIDMVVCAEALTEPLARCAAALRARAAVIEAGAKAETVEG